MQLILMRGPFSRTSVLSIKTSHVALLLVLLVMLAGSFMAAGLYLAARYGEKIPVVQDIVYSFVSTFDRHRDELYPEMFADGAHGGIGPGAEYTDFDFSAVLGSCNQILK